MCVFHYTIEMNNNILCLPYLVLTLICLFSLFPLSLFTVMILPFRPVNSYDMHDLFADYLLPVVLLLWSSRHLMSALQVIMFYQFVYTFYTSLIRTIRVYCKQLAVYSVFIILVNENVLLLHIVHLPVF